MQYTDVQPPVEGSAAAASAKHALEFWRQRAWRAAQDANVANMWERALQQAELDSAEATVLRRAALMTGSAMQTQQYGLGIP